MSPLMLFLILLIALTSIIVVYLTKQFQEENLIYSYTQSVENDKLSADISYVEKEKVIAETLNGRFAMIGLIAAVGAYLTTGQLIPGVV